MFHYLGIFGNSLSAGALKTKKRQPLIKGYVYIVVSLRNVFVKKTRCV